MTLVSKTGSAYAAQQTCVTPYLQYFEVLFGGEPAAEGSSKVLEFKSEFSIACSATANIIGKSVVCKHRQTQWCSQMLEIYE